MIKLTIICPRTRYAELTRSQAILVIILLIAIFDWCFYVNKIISNDNIYNNLYGLLEKLDDAVLYESVARRIRQGEGYYDAAATELMSRGYPTDSVFKWRTPVYAWILGKLPNPSWGRSLLVACTILAVASACLVVGPEGGAAMQLAMAVGLAGSYGWLVHPYPTYFMEFWSGLFISISSCWIGLGKWCRGVLAAVVALALRELALPYVALVSFWALQQRRRSAFVALLMVTAVHLLLFGFHYRCVVHHSPVAVSAQWLEWVTLGGTEFILSTCRMNFLLAALPPWCATVYFPLSLLGLIGWKGSGAMPIRSTAIAYLLLFAVVGKPFDFYWGWLCMPLLFMGLLWSPLAIRDLVAAMSE